MGSEDEQEAATVSEPPVQPKAFLCPTNLASISDILGIVQPEEAKQAEPPMEAIKPTEAKTLSSQPSSQKPGPYLPWPTPTT